MKRFKKLGSLLMAFVMAMSLGVSVFADAPNDGSIVIHKYDSTGTISSEDANKLNDGQLIDDEDVLDTLGSTLEGIPFRVTQVKDIVGGADVATSTLTVAQAQAIITANAAHYVGTTPALYQKTLETTADGEAEFGRLALGVYLVEELPNSISTDITKPFLVHIPLTVSNTDTTVDPHVTTQSLIYDVHVYPKNEELFIDKVIDGGSEGGKTISKNIGDQVEWNINAGIPADIASIDLTTGSGYFFIEDELDDRLDYVSTNVYFVDENGDPVDTTANPQFALVAGTDYTLTAPTSTSSIVKVDFNTSTGITKLAAAAAAGYTIQIDITTTINMNAAYDLDSPIGNSAELYYKNEGGDPSNPEDPIVPPTDPEVIVTGLSVVKFDKDDPDEYLQGAEFDLYWSADGTTYNKVAAGTTDANGLIYWKFNADETNGWGASGVGYGYFYVKETKAPSDYELLGSISTVIQLDADNENGTWKLANIKLSEDFELPTTGGMGTILYTVAGLLLIGGALVIFFVSKKRKKTSDTK